MSGTSTDTTIGTAFCPHCGLEIDEGHVRAQVPWPPEAQRCPHCRLLIGSGRARSEASTEPGTKGAAAGVLARRARRSTEEPEHAPDEVLAAIRAIAELLEVSPERLLMVDYREHADADPAVPPLSDVFTHFGTWKSARREAGRS